MRNKFTDGPWVAHKYPDVKTWTVAAKESVASKIKTPEDAALIASAPELVEALEFILDHVNRCSKQDHATNEYGLGKIKTNQGTVTAVDAHLIKMQINHALAKARGEV